MYEFVRESEKPGYQFCYYCNYHCGSEECNNCTYSEEE